MTSPRVLAREGETALVKMCDSIDALLDAIMPWEKADVVLAMLQTRLLIWAISEQARSSEFFRMGEPDLGMHAAGTLAAFERRYRELPLH